MAVRHDLQRSHCDQPFPVTTCGADGPAGRHDFALRHFRALRMWMAPLVARDCATRIRRSTSARLFVHPHSTEVSPSVPHDTKYAVLTSAGSYFARFPLTVWASLIIAMPVVSVSRKNASLEL